MQAEIVALINSELKRRQFEGVGAALDCCVTTDLRRIAENCVITAPEIYFYSWQFNSSEVWESAGSVALMKHA